MKNNMSRIAVLSLAVAVAASFTSCGAKEDGGNCHTANDSKNWSYDSSKYEDNCDEYISGDYTPAAEEYNKYAESGIKDPKTEPLSTFSIDTDTASYTNARRFIEDGMIVPNDSVRVEEFINYFDYDYVPPSDGDKFSSYTEIADCPWNPEKKLMMIGIQGEDIEKSDLPPSNLVFLIDSSGSMASYDKLPLVQTAFTMLTENLRADDRISIVTYAGSSSTLISGGSRDNRDDIVEALYSITARGGTNGEGGIETAYALAEEYFIEGGNNRVILATDGDLNIGKSSEKEITELIESKRSSGIYLSVLGFGTGNLKDNRLEALADNGNGSYSYIDSVEEARRVLVEEMGGTLFTIAKDVKIQVEFNPSQVKSYRLIGYDNRLMNAEDFYNTSKDAGEIGAGHSVTAVYEVELAENGGSYHGIPLEFASEHEQDSEPMSDEGRTELCKLSVAYKDVSDNDRDVCISQLFGMEQYNAVPSDRMKLASAVTEFALLLKESEYKGSADFDRVLETAMSLQGRDDKTDNFAELVSNAYRLYR